MKFLHTLALLFIALAPPVFAQDAPSANDNALFLAGLPVAGTSLDALGKEKAWSRHAEEFDSSWKSLDARQLAKIRAWAPTALGDGFKFTGPMFYMFSGPDILYAQTLFPNASTYVLCGLEPVGAIPDVKKLSAGVLSGSLGNLRKSLNSVLSFSFFITKDMKNDLHNTQLSGTLPVIYVFLARAGCKLESTEFVGLDKEGAFTTEKPATNGAKIVFTGANGQKQTLYYFTADISNGGLKSNPAMMKFCEGLGEGVSLLKAASYLMHSDEFSNVRDFLLGHSKLICQDDSGIPIRYFDSEKWDVKPFGNYVGPIELFKNRNQSALASLYKKSSAPKLTFSFGYRWHASESTIVVATPKGAAAPAPAAAPAAAPEAASAAK